MKKISTLFVLAFFAVVTAVAQSVFPKVQALVPQGGAGLSAPLKVNSAGKDKTLYCGVVNDLLYRNAGLATFNTKDPMNTLNLYGPIYKVDDKTFYSPLSGACVGDKFYAFTYLNFTFVSEQRGYGYFDMKTGEWHKVADQQPHDTNPEFQDYEVVYSMAYDHSTQTMYCLYFDIMDYVGTIKSCNLATVDLETGQYTKIASLNNLYYGLACDYSGQLYSMTYHLQTPGDINSGIVGTDLYKFYFDRNNIEEEFCKEIKSSDGSRMTTYFLQDFDFDHEDWVIRWNRIDNQGTTFVCELDPETAVYSNSQLIGSSAVVVGIHAPFIPADNADAPGKVTNLTATPEQNGRTAVTLSWTNPTKTWSRQTLDKVIAVDIYRNDELIATVTEGVELGSSSSYVDSRAKEGINTYKLVPRRQEGENGKPEVIEAFAGKDAPGAVVNLTLTSDDGQTSTLTWQKPAAGLHGGWYDPTTLTYDVTRLPDNTLVAENISDTRFVDALTKTANYSYTVKTRNAQGEGAAATSNAMTIGPAIVPPYSASFSSSQAANMWTPCDANNDGDGWHYEGFWKAWISNEYGNKTYDWIFSPEIYLEKGQSYRVRFLLSRTSHSMSVKENAAFAYGNGKTAEAMTHQLGRVDNLDNIEERYYSFTLTADESGAVNFGLLSDSENGSFGTYFYGFAINSINANDLAAESISGPTQVAATVANDYTVKVVNKGAVAPEAYSVQLVDDDDNVLGETKVSEALAPQGEKDVVVTWTPAAELVDKSLLVYGRVILNGDGDASNDNTDTPLSVKVGEASDSKWYDFTGGSWKKVDSGVTPVSYMYKSSWTETLYTAAQIGLPEGQYEITKVSYDYTFGTPVEADLAVYVGSTQQKVYNNVEEDIIGKSELTLVCDTVFDVNAGKGSMVFSFKAPYLYDTKDNLVIAIDRPLNSYNDGDIFDNHFSAIDTEDYYQFYAIQYGYDKSSFDWSGSYRTYATSEMPITHLFVRPVGGEDGIIEVVIDSMDGGRNGKFLNGQRIVIGKDGRYYDLTGRKF